MVTTGESHVPRDRRASVGGGSHGFLHVQQGIDMRKMIKAALAGAVLGAVPAGAATVIVAGTAGTTGATALYMTLPGEISTSDATATAAELATYLGRPDDDYTGLGGQSITYDLGFFRLIDGAGQDFNVYEVDGGNVEFSSLTVAVSADGTTFSTLGTSLAAIDLAGDEAHGNASFRRSFDVGSAVTALGATQFRFVRLTGTGSAPISGDNGFDPDAVGYANFVDLTPVNAVPEPATWAMLIGGFGAIGGVMRRRRVAIRFA